MKQEYTSYFLNVNCTSIPYWDERCGEYFYNENEFEKTFNLFISKLEIYRPREYILENLSVDKCSEKFLKLIKNNNISPIYKNYCNSIKNIYHNEINNFKKILNNGILENVSYKLGSEYLNLIESEFININYNDIFDFIKLNDKNGNPETYNYIFMNKNINCSPSTLRYIYHSLVILDYYNKTECKNIIELGCGYGGLCLAINFFSKLLNIEINNYNIIDLSESYSLINNYLDLNKSNIHCNINYHLSHTYGENIKDNLLFFISNYCYTEIEYYHNLMYSKILLPKTINGFIIWQNGGNNGIYPITESNKITQKNIINICEEKPQTDSGYDIYKNYFVYF
jgi:hypothetical protein